MKNNITNKDENGKLHGLQIDYYLFGNIRLITNYHHGLWHGYRAYFHSDNSIVFEAHFNNGKYTYSENYHHKQIKINI